MRRAPVGELELEVLGFIADNHPVSVRRVAEEFGGPRDLARTTILTVMENLRKKGYLARRKEGRAFVYSPSVPPAELLMNLARTFVERTLGGSVSPIVAYLDQTRRISDRELDELQRLVEKLRTERREAHE